MTLMPKKMKNKIKQNKAWPVRKLACNDDADAEKMKKIK